MPAPAIVMLRVFMAQSMTRGSSVSARDALAPRVGAALEPAGPAQDDGVRAGGEQVGAHAVPVGLHLQRMPDGLAVVNLDLEADRRGCRSS